MRTYSTEVIS